MITSLVGWLKQPVIEHHDVDRPFRLRRVSLLLLASGWGVFLICCLAGTALVQMHVPIQGWADLLHGTATEFSWPALQWARAVCELTGAVLFFAGLFSVAVADRRDGARVRVTR